MDAGGRDAGEGDAHLVYDSDYKTFTFVQTFAASGENAANLVWGLGIGQKRRFITQENSQKTIHAGIGYNRRHKKPEVPRTKLHVISQNRWMLDGCSMDARWLVVL